MPRLSKRLITIPILVAGMALAASQLTSAGPHHAHHRTPIQADPLIVHEWGTFTSMVGANGVVLEGMQHAEEKLPGFVHTRTSEVADPFQRYGNRSVNQRRIRRTRTKMETPVIYFYSKRKRRVKVRVEYTKGLLSQYYPAPSKSGPGERRGIDLSKLKKSFLEWDLDLLPNLTGDKLPKVGAHPYGYSREVKATALRNRSGSATPEYEKFIFYRGLGHATPPLGARAQRNNKVTLFNGFGRDIPAAFAIEMKGNRGRFVSLGKVAKNTNRSVNMNKARFAPKDRVVAQLAGKVMATLVELGLYKDEARAMVRTWSESWFASEGTRFVYVVPNNWTNSILPLTISPRPAKLVRVLVGRLDYLTPEHEDYVERALRDRLHRTASVRENAMRRLGRLGRFIEPKVRRIFNKTRSRLVAKSARQILAAIKRRAGN